MSVNKKLRKLGWELEKDDIYYSEYKNQEYTVRIIKTSAGFGVDLSGLTEIMNNDKIFTRLLFPKENRLFWKKAKQKNKELQKNIRRREKCQQ